MDQERGIQIERAQNLWSSFVRSLDPLARGAHITPEPKLDFDQIGGLTKPKDEILTYACAATDPDVYSRWGTFPPSGILLIGAPGVGKRLLAEALATRTGTSFVRVDVPRMVLDMVHASSKVGELIQGWSQVLEEMPPLTVFFDELEFSQTHDLGRAAAGPADRPDHGLPARADRPHHRDREQHLVIASTGHPDTLRFAFVKPGRFERIVEVTPIFPDDVVEALLIHAARAEKRSERKLFDDIDWRKVVSQNREAATGDWVRILHGTLRRKARCEAAGEEAGLVDFRDLDEEVARYSQAHQRLRFTNGGNYL